MNQVESTLEWAKKLTSARKVFVGVGIFLVGAILLFMFMPSVWQSAIPAKSMSKTKISEGAATALQREMRENRGIPEFAARHDQTITKSGDQLVVLVAVHGSKPGSNGVWFLSVGKLDDQWVIDDATVPGNGGNFTLNFEPPLPIK